MLFIYARELWTTGHWPNGLLCNFYYPILFVYMLSVILIIYIKYIKYIKYILYILYNICILGTDYCSAFLPYI